MLAGRAHGAALVRFRLPASAGGGRFTLPLPADIAPVIADGMVSFRTESPTRALTPLFLWATERGEELDALTVTRPSLEDVYLELTEGAVSDDRRTDDSSGSGSGHGLGSSPGRRA